MKQLVVAIYDHAAQLYAQPAFVQSKAVAIRSFSDEVGRVSSPERPNPLYDHPGDFDLRVLGVFDSATGRFLADADGPQVAIRASEVASIAGEVK